MHNMFDQILELSLFTGRVVTSLMSCETEETESKRACSRCEIQISGFKIYASK